MNTVETNIALAGLTSFGIAAKAQQLMRVDSVADVLQVLKAAEADAVPLTVLGGGSNVLCTHDVRGMVMKIEIMGRRIVAEDDATVTVEFGAGESWHDVVAWTVENGWGGLENLALIPGTVGAAPMQNIGAYGTEQASCAVSVTYVDRRTHTMHTLDADACAFGYRESVFKHALRDVAIITSVRYRLQRHPTVNTTYADVRNELQVRGVAAPTIRDVFDAVVAIRTRKLPDPAVIGNAGSFFKNPVVDAETYTRLRSANADMPAYPQADGTYKLAAAWLIDQCGWKGHRDGDAGVHVNQALVLVNYGGATGRQILELSKRIVASVHDAFGVTLEREVNVW
ncbi:MAG: UDP-N-acetylmuramate dehydrogenase [Candidatus Kapabacteria bacterium]|nr:UDP-N-acetylmuramate dehydrogenase [Candidatus Kapabacteria bacterium]